MAIRAATVVVDNDGVVKITWTGLRVNDTGAWVKVARYADKTVQVIVDAGGSGDVVTMQGSPDGGTTTGILHNAQGGDLAADLTGASISDPELIAESPESIRPSITAGDGTTDLTVVVVAPSRGK